MNKKDTGHLDMILEKTSIEGLEDYIENEEILPEYTIQSYFNEYIADHELKASEIIENSQIAREYAYQILNGRKKNPSRDKILALCLGAKMPLKDIQRVLKLSHQGILYAKNVRDAVIIVCIHHNIYEISTINDYLQEKNCPPLR